MTSGPAKPFSVSEQFNPKVLTALQGLDLKARYVMEGFLSGLHASPFHGMSVEFSEYRSYQPGDDLRQLDWRLYARSDHLYIKRHLDETNVRFYIICDTSGSMGYRGSRAWGSKLDCARIIAAAMIWFLIRQKDAAGMLALNATDKTPQFIRPSQKPSQMGTLFRYLDRLRPEGNGCLEYLTDLSAKLFHRRSVILIFSDLLDPSENIVNCLKRLRFQGHDCLMFQVLDYDETNFPFTEPKIFHDMENGTKRSVSPAKVRELYLERFNSFMDSHRETLRSLEIPHCVMNTHETPWKALAMFLRERRKLG